VGVLVPTTPFDITQSPRSSVATSTAVLTAANISLPNFANDFDSLGFPLADGNVTLTDIDDLTLTASTMTGTVILTVGTDLVQGGALNLAGNLTINAGRDILLPLGGIPGNALASDANNVVTIERARDVTIGVQNNLRLNVATAALPRPNPPFAISRFG